MSCLFCSLIACCMSRGHSNTLVTCAAVILTLSSSQAIVVVGEIFLCDLFFEVKKILFFDCSRTTPTPKVNPELTFLGGIRMWMRRERKWGGRKEESTSRFYVFFPLSLSLSLSLSCCRFYCCWCYKKNCSNTHRMNPAWRRTRWRLNLAVIWMQCRRSSENNPQTTTKRVREGEWERKKKKKKVSICFTVWESSLHLAVLFSSFCDRFGCHFLSLEVKKQTKYLRHFSPSPQIATQNFPLFWFIVKNF